MASSALMVTGSFDRESGTATSAMAQTIQQFQVRTPNAPIIQGQINTVRVSEVMFPYSTPTVINSLATNPNADNSLMYLGCIMITYNAGGTTLQISLTTANPPVRLPTGFYTGAEMATAIQTILTAGGVSFAALTCAWNDTLQRITFTNTSTWDTTDGVTNYIYIINPFGSGIRTDPTVALQQPELEWTLGLRSLCAQFPPAPILNFPNPPLPAPQIPPYNYCLAISPLNYPNAPGDILSTGGTFPNNYLPVFRPGSYSNVLYGSPYSGRYTDYIDIVSPSLCANQFVRDGNTNQNIVKKDIIARIYIADDNSYPPNFGTGNRPFLIHRQFTNPKYLRWTVERSVDVIQLELYDQFGNALPVTYPIAWNGVSVAPMVGEQSDYAITFLAAEYNREKTGNIGYGY